MFLANSRVSILRGTYQNSVGDQVEADNAVYTGVLMSIREVASNETTVAEGMPRQVRYLVGRAPAGTDVKADDRLLDEDTGFIYFVDGVDEVSTSPIMDSGIRLELRRVS